MTAHLVGIYACVAIALHELAFRRAVGDDGLTPLGAKVFAWAWPVWACLIALVWLIDLALNVARWRKS